MAITVSPWCTLAELKDVSSSILKTRTLSGLSSSICLRKNIVTHVPSKFKVSSSFPDTNISPETTSSNGPTTPQVHTRIWKWRDYSIRYQYSGNSGPSLVLVHGFGANSDHWRKNIQVLAESHRVYSIDLIGYGYSDKPNPREFGVNAFYTFETWATQLNDFCSNVVNGEAFFICNSIGGLVGLQAAVMEPQICKGIVLLNISLRMLHIKKQPWYGRPFISLLQSLLRNTEVGKFFFKSVATSNSVRSILSQCYHDISQVTDELVEKILLPGLEPGAVDVFLEFICYSGGPLPEELLPQVKCPVLVAWGDKDPWEPIELGKVYKEFSPVEDFIVLPDVGHCPQDEAPYLVNPLVEKFVARHTSSKASVSNATNVQDCMECDLLRVEAKNNFIARQAVVTNILINVHLIGAIKGKPILCLTDETEKDGKILNKNTCKTITQQDWFLIHLRKKKKMREATREF